MGAFQSRKKHSDTLFYYLKNKANYYCIIYHIDRYQPFLLNINATDKDGKSAIFYALYSLDIVRFMVMHTWVNINKVDNMGRNVLFYADKPDVFKYLIKKGVDPTLVDKNGENLLFHIKPSELVLDILLNKGIDINKVNNIGETCVKGNYTVQQLDLLVRNGYNLHYVDQSGKDILSYYIDSNSPHKYKILLYLHAKGVNINPNSIKRLGLMPDSFVHSCKILESIDNISSVSDDDLLSVVKDAIKLNIYNNFLFCLQEDRLRKVLPLFNVTNVDNIDEVSDLPGDDLLKIFGRQYVQCSICLDNLETDSAIVSTSCCSNFFGIHEHCYARTLPCLICGNRNPIYVKTKR